MELQLNEALQRGIEAHRDGRLQEAERYYSAILRKQSNHPDANHNMGVLAVAVGKNDEAVLFFEKALTANSDVSQFWLSFIEALIRCKRFTQAKEELKKVKVKEFNQEKFLELEEQVVKKLEAASVPNFLEKLSMAQAMKLAKKSLKEGSSEKARNIYQNILAKFPGNKDARRGLRQISENGSVKKFKTTEPPQHKLQMLSKLYDQGGLKQVLSQISDLRRLYPGSFTLFNIEGGVFKRLGKLTESINSFKKALALKPDFSDAAYNMGIVLKEQGKRDEAIQAYKHAISIKPNYAEAHNNLGIVLQEKGELDDALKAYQKAILVNSGYAEAHYNLGIILHEQGDINGAVTAYEKAISKKTNYVDAYFNLGNALMEQDRFREAIAIFKKVLKIKPDYPEVLFNISTVLPRIKFNERDPHFLTIINSLLDQKFFSNPSEISSAVLSLLKHEPGVKELFEKQTNGKKNDMVLDSVRAVCRIPVLLRLMSICPLTDLNFERVFTNIRSQILNLVITGTKNEDLLQFQSALALHCFTNEYVFRVSDKEKNNIKIVENKIKETLLNGQQPNPQSVLCLASYRGLFEYDWTSFLRVNKEIEEVYNRQILEPVLELQLKDSISILKKITGTISSKVRDQYEKNPYPRWINLKLPFRPTSISKIVRDANLRIVDKSIQKTEFPEILIAGCGTGRHSILTAKRFRNARVTAVDLSLASLAYAKRKTEEMNLTNIEYLQADILDLKMLEKEFDIIESVGVLHHMKKPMDGWKVLTNCLKKGGLMKIGLYSEYARNDIVKIRGEIKSMGINSTDIEMREFRSDLIKSKKAHHKGILESKDFYSLSELRDLLFHSQEHRFNLLQIRDALFSLGLEFCGFEKKIHFKMVDSKNTLIDDRYDLTKWDLYERSNPTIFAGMYEFWCQKL